MQAENTYLKTSHTRRARASAALFGIVLLITIGLSSSPSLSSLFVRAEPSSQTASVTPVPSVLDDISVSAEAAIVVDLATSKIRYQKNPRQQLPLASITKLMTALTAYELLEPTDIVTITETDLAREGDSGLQVGERWYVKDLIHFTLLVSSNDGAQALARTAGGVLSATRADAAVIERMNQRAQELGLTQTYFLDASGLDESETMASAYGSAYDIAHLVAYIAQTKPELLAATTRATQTFTTLTGTVHEAKNTNDIVSLVPGMIGGKTGFTDLAGGNLAIAFDAGLTHTVVVVVLGSTQEGRFADVQMLVHALRTDLRKAQ